MRNLDHIPPVVARRIFEKSPVACHPLMQCHAMPLGHRKKKNSKCEKVCCVKKRVACLASLVGLCPSCTSCTWAFDCPLCSPVVRSAALSTPGDIHLFDLTFIPVPLVLPPPLECVFDVVLSVIPTSCYVRLRGIHCRGLEKVFRGSRVLTEPRLALVQHLQALGFPS